MKIKIRCVTFVAIITLFGCKTFHSLKALPPLPDFDTEGHRGARGLAPENTIPGMYRALQHNITTLEMDVHITADRKVVLAHDSHLNPLFTLDSEGKEIGDTKRHVLYQMKYADVKKFDVGSKGNSKFPDQQKIKTVMPLLEDVIDSVQAKIKKDTRKQVFYNIETKSKPEGDHILHPAPEQFVRLLMDVIEKKKLTPWVIIQSFDRRTLQVIHGKYPMVRTALLVENKDSMEKNLEQLGFVPTIYSPHYKLVDKALVDKSHDRNMKVIPWTVNTLEEISTLKELNVDGIISDYPNLFGQIN
ncbi:MAG TPA: glycerophosphodiester phosphodiesterase family protein [Sphingobacteriaceae bacterium]|nr:glycerophosphodiester phosphodiesterase family protein [Sphingobacteriaceae bacterium]